MRQCLNAIVAVCRCARKLPSAILVEFIIDVITADKPF